MKLFTSMLMLILTTAFLHAQVPADQEVIVIEGGTENIGLLEKTINEDVLADGSRINPNRVYMLKANTIYFMQSRIQFGGPDIPESNATLTIIGEEGGKKPIILSSPLDGGDAFTHNVHGSLTLKNIYWPARTTSNKGATLFSLLRTEQTLYLEDMVHEFALNGDLYSLRQVEGPANIIIKNSYFRDNSQFANSFNFAVVARGDNGEPIDSLIVQNSTVANSGLTFFGKNNPINFVFFDHNTIVNTPKYVFFFEQYKEAYFTNNIFINCNWEGECQSTQETQLQSQIENALTGGHPVGITNLMPIDSNLWQLGHGSVPAQEDVKWLSSNNVHFTSPFLNNYYNGQFNDVGDYPLSYRAWSADIEEGDLPIPVTSVPPPFISDYTQNLVDQYEGVIAEGNFDNTLDLDMVTKSIPDQTIGDEFARMGRRNYGVPNPGEFDPLSIAFGDLDPTTVPGVETENGDGISTVTDFIEDFSYTSDARSAIDNKPMGSLLWWTGDEGQYDEDGALQTVLDYYQFLLEGDTTVNVLAGFNGSFEQDLQFWRFYEVPNSLGSVAEIVTDPEHVIDGEKAAKVTYVAADETLVDRSLDNWDSNMPLEAGKEYFGSFYAKKDSASTGAIAMTMGFFDGDRNVVGEQGASYPLTNEYQQFYFNFTTTEDTEKGWLAFRWKSLDGADFVPGIVYLDHIQLSRDSLVVSVEDLLGVDKRQGELKAVYPNPFNTSTTINYSLSEASNVEITIFDLYGRSIKQLVNEKLPAGAYEVEWSPNDAANGIYVVAMRAGRDVSFKQIVLQR